MIRNSVVRKMKVNENSFSSIINIGDTVYAEPYIRAIAIQKEGAFFLPDSFPFENYPIFSRPFPEMTGKRDLSQSHFNHHPDILVDGIRIIGASGSSIIHIGKLENIDARARVKHIRILERDISNTDHQSS
ncbi:uncharacterized protein DUF2772 [Melghiribacillus thermohalophilus]|uniref:Uncharacterized protein DUF2772 n=1 Tax=Melghiribacillus thermohalophilus TaxID=1324956 RepID=A0A4R3MQ95_9BACI|nr:spore germination protein GerPE [Melghiribacillus thermohalophilus]TCT16693.1 uncharacterized protein DUF2772 [Melghiribacillus thermohalophilus]